MKHTLRKFISCRGSALIMVLGTMFALLVAVMAMYFSVVSSRSVQYAVFNQEQSYQSALSLQNAMIGGFSDGTLNSVLSYITKDTFKVGDVYATTVGGTENDESNGVGRYEMTITRVDDEDVNGTTALTFDVATTVEVNGVFETTHVFYHVFPQIEESATGSSQIFAATGYVPNNVDVTSGKFATTSSFDNEIVNIGNGSTEYFLCGNFYCGGSLAFYRANNSTDKLKEAIDIVVRDTLYLHSIGSNLFLAPSSSTEQGNIYVGKDLHMEGGFKLNASNLYVLGDVYLQGGITLDNGHKLHVDGDFHWYGDSLPTSTNIEVGPKTKFYLHKSDGSVQVCSNPGYGTWADDSANAAVEYIKSTTDTRVFKEWELPANTLYTYKPIEFNARNGQYTATLPFSSVSTDTKTYTRIGDIVNNGIPDNGKVLNFTIYIDTGDNPENIHYIKLNPNCTVGDDFCARGAGTPANPYNGFTWYPRGVNSLPADDSQRNINILVRGRGSVVIDAESVIYLPSPYEKFMHESWAYLLKGGDIKTTDGGVTYNKVEVRGKSDSVRKYIHVNCEAGCSRCDYKSEKSTTEKCSECDHYMTKITCANHNYELMCCTNASCKKCNEPKKQGGKYFGLCENRIDRKAVDDSGVNLPKDGSGNTYYPNNNIFLVSNQESAEIYISDYAWLETLGSSVTGDTEEVNSCTYFGFIYAPYMTFKGTHLAEEDVVRFCGGMVVSDYIFGDNSWYMSCYPDLMPEQLGANKDLPSPNKLWKVEVARN